MSNFDATKKKVEWTERQISDLEAGFAAFLQANPCTWETTTDPDTGALAFEAHCPEQLPLELTLMLGEAISNLRSVLDRATEGLIEIDTGTEDIKATFPTAAKQADYIARCRDIKTRRDDTKAFFMNLAAYPDGAGKTLYALDQLEITGKHKVLTSFIGVAKIGPVKILNSDGSLASTTASMECSMDMDGRTRLMNLSPGTSVEIDKNAKPTFDAFFGDVAEFRFQRIIPVFRVLAGAVRETVRRFEKFVATRF